MSHADSMSGERSRAAAQITLRPIGSPLTVGMSGLAIASLVQTGVDLHWVAATQTRDAGLILLAVPFVLQLLACIFSYLARDGATGAAVGVLSTSWLALGLIHIVSAPGSTSGALGLLLVATGGVLGLTALAISTQKPLPGLIFGAAATRFMVAGVYELSAAAAWQDAAGLLGLLVCGLAAYAVIAFELEGQRERPVLPTFRPRARRDPAGAPGGRARSARDDLIAAVAAARPAACGAHRPVRVPDRCDACRPEDAAGHAGEGDRLSAAGRPSQRCP
jgi:succinate-acetate transporter protein